MPKVFSSQHQGRFCLLPRLTSRRAPPPVLRALPPQQHHTAAPHSSTPRPPSRIIWERTSRPPSRIVLGAPLASALPYRPRPPSRIILGAAFDRAADGGRRAASHTAVSTYISKDQNFSSPAARHSIYTPKFFFACGAPFDLHPKNFLRLRRAIRLTPPNFSSPPACHSTYSETGRSY